METSQAIPCLWCMCLKINLLDFPSGKRITRAMSLNVVHISFKGLAHIVHIMARWSLTAT